MPQGKGTYGSKVGRPKKKKGLGVGMKKRRAIRKSAKQNAALRGLKGKAKRKYVRGVKKAFKKSN